MSTGENLKGTWYINDVHIRSVGSEWVSPIINSGQGNLTDAWVGGGRNTQNSEVSTFVRITFASDTNTAQNRSNLTQTHSYTGAVGNVSDAWYFSGEPTSRISRLTFSNDLSNSLIRGNIPSAFLGSENRVTSTGNATDGWVVNSGIARLTFSNDTVNIPTRGQMETRRISAGSTGNATDGWVVGGGLGLTTPTSNVDRIIFANDTITASRRGNLNTSRLEMAAAGNATNGWVVAGLVSGTATMTSRVDRITFSNDTVTAQQRANNPIAIDDFDGSSNLTDGWFVAGGLPITSLISRIIFASDTNTPQTRGPMPESRWNHGVSS